MSGFLMRLDVVLCQEREEAFKSWMADRMSRLECVLSHAVGVAENATALLLRELAEVRAAREQYDV